MSELFTDTAPCGREHGEKEHGIRGANDAKDDGAFLAALLAVTLGAAQSGHTKATDVLVYRYAGSQTTAFNPDNGTTTVRFDGTFRRCLGVGCAAAGTAVAQIFVRTDSCRRISTGTMAIAWSNGKVSTVGLSVILLSRVTAFAGRITSAYNRGLAIAGLVSFPNDPCRLGTRAFTGNVVIG